MSTRDIYEYLIGEYQTISLEEQAPASTEAQYYTHRGIDIVGYDIALFSDSIGTNELVIGVDYTLSFKDYNKSAAEQAEIYAGYRVNNVTYQGVPLYLSMKVIGGYTKYTGGKYEVVTTTSTITPNPFGYSVYVDNGASDVTITFNDAERVDDRIIVYAMGTGNVTIAGSGISDLITETMISYNWVGTEYLRNALSIGFYETIYIINATQPITPTGDTPAGWTTTPPTRLIGETIWASRSFKNEDEIVVGAWSVPTMWSGDDGLGVPEGGTINQVLTKDSSTDNDTSWKTVSTDALTWDGAAKTVSANDPTGGADDDIWFKY